MEQNELLEIIDFELRGKKINGFSFTNLNLCHRFYLIFSQTIQALRKQFYNTMSLWSKRWTYKNS